MFHADWKIKKMIHMIVRNLNETRIDTMACYLEEAMAQAGCPNAHCSMLCCQPITPKETLEVHSWLSKLFVSFHQVPFWPNVISGHIGLFLQK
jgi:hypothetical protein